MSLGEAAKSHFLVPLRRLPKVFPRRPQQLVLGGALSR
jgi:hypothetical protein